MAKTREASVRDSGEKIQMYKKKERLFQDYELGVALPFRPRAVQVGEIVKSCSYVRINNN